MLPGRKKKNTVDAAVLSSGATALSHRDVFKSRRLDTNSRSASKEVAGGRREIALGASIPHRSVCSMMVEPRKVFPSAAVLTFLFSFFFFSIGTFFCCLSVCGSARVYVPGLGGRSPGAPRCFPWFSRLRSSQTTRSPVWAAEHL